MKLIDLRKVAINRAQHRHRLMPNLRGDSALFVDLAVASFPDETRVGILAAPHDSCRKHVGLDEHLRILCIRDHGSGA